MYCGQSSNEHWLYLRCKTIKPWAMLSLVKFSPGVTGAVKCVSLNEIQCLHVPSKSNAPLQCP